MGLYHQEVNTFIELLLLVYAWTEFIGLKVAALYGVKKVYDYTILVYHFIRIQIQEPTAARHELGHALHKIESKLDKLENLTAGKKE